MLCFQQLVRRVTKKHNSEMYIQSAAVDALEEATAALAVDLVEATRSYAQRRASGM